jgi:hypothetical protein
VLRGRIIGVRRIGPTAIRILGVVLMVVRQDRKVLHHGALQLARGGLHVLALLRAHVELVLALHFEGRLAQLLLRAESGDHHVAAAVVGPHLAVLIRLLVLVLVHMLQLLAFI